MAKHTKQLGVITRGSLVEGLEMKLDPEVSVEDIKAGKFVVVEGEKNEFFSMITDVRLDATNPDILAHPPSQDDNLMRSVLSGTSTYVTVSLRPMLMLPNHADEVFEYSRIRVFESVEHPNTRTPEHPNTQLSVNGAADPRPVKTIPGHFSTVYEAAESDVSRVFGSEESDDEKYFNIGTPLDMETPVCLNLDRFIERSNGIFGKTGTGKTFLTRLVLAGLIRANRAVNFIFDMHNEYGWQSQKESGSGRRGFVKGLRQLFPANKIAIFSLDPESTRRRGASADVEVKISYDQITVDDIAPLQEELRLHPTAVESAYLIVSRYGKNWLKVLLEQDETGIKDFAESLGAHPESISALYRKLKSRLERLPFLTKEPQPLEDVVDKIMGYVDRGVHIILEFGRQHSMLCYLLVANIITRRLHELYLEKTEKYLSTLDAKDEPRQLVITIEEAHKFLNPNAARQTPFGIIAREMRKFYVSLLIIDQRPSSIDDEVLSQIGTRIIALLNDEKDIQAVLTGVSNTSGLRSVLASLDSKQQALVIGHAVPMPVVIKTREYDETFYAAMGALDGEEKKAKRKKDIEALFG